jgi:hypothetical protein
MRTRFFLAALVSLLVFGFERSAVASTVCDAASCAAGNCVLASNPTQSCFYASGMCKLAESYCILKTPTLQPPSPPPEVPTSCNSSTANCPGHSCTNLGTTQMSDDHNNIIACVISGSPPNPTALVWKTTVSDFTCPANQIVIAISNGLPQCVDITSQINVSSCPSGTMLVGISNGNPVCASAP